jgi:very-short-patch-repair endonuclease
VTSLDRLLAAHDGVVTRAQLEGAGFTAYRRQRALADGQLIRIRNGWFAAVGAPEQIVRAVRVGGRLTCASALAHRGLWTMPDSRLHIALASNACRLRSPDDRHEPLDPADPSLALHWRHYAHTSHAAVDSVESAASHLLRCAAQDSAIVTIDSALNSGQLSLAGLNRVLARLPGRYGRVAELVDARAESGLETLARLRLRRRGIRVTTQVQIAGVGRVDVLIGDRLILELDGRGHHLGEQFERDRGRDLRATAGGYLPLRVSYRQVLYEWNAIELAIVQLVRRGEHEWRGMHHRLGLASTVVTENAGKTAGRATGDLAPPQSPEFAGHGREGRTSAGHGREGRELLCRRGRGVVASVASGGGLGRDGLGAIVVGQLLEEAERRVDGERAARDVNGGHDRLDERHENITGCGGDCQQILRRKVVDLRDRSHLRAVTEHAQADELVVEPGVFLIRFLCEVLVDPENRLDEGLGRRAVGHALEEGNGLQVVPLELNELEGFAMPVRAGRHLQRERGTRGEAAGRIVGVELEFDSALEAVGLEKTRDSQLRLTGQRWCSHR